MMFAAACGTNCGAAVVLVASVAGVTLVGLAVIIGHYFGGRR